MIKALFRSYKLLCGIYLIKHLLKQERVVHGKVLNTVQIHHKIITQ